MYSYLLHAGLYMLKYANILEPSFCFCFWKLQDKSTTPSSGIWLWSQLFQCLRKFLIHLTSIVTWEYYNHNRSSMNFCSLSIFVSLCVLGWKLRGEKNDSRREGARGVASSHDGFQNLTERWKKWAEKGVFELIWGLSIVYYPRSELWACSQLTLIVEKVADTQLCNMHYSLISSETLAVPIS